MIKNTMGIRTSNPWGGIPSGKPKADWSSQSLRLRTPSGEVKKKRKGWRQNQVLSDGFGYRMVTVKQIEIVTLRDSDGKPLGQATFGMVDGHRVQRTGPAWDNAGRWVHV